MKSKIDLIKELGDAMASHNMEISAPEVKRDQLTAADFDSTDPTKMVGDTATLVLQSMKDISLDMGTPMMGVLESKTGLEVKSTTFDMIHKTIDVAAADEYKVGESDDVYDPTHTFARKTNNIMTMGVGVSRKILPSILTQIPASNQLDAEMLSDALKGLAIAKEHFIFNGDKSKFNETDGILTILTRENTAGNTATSFVYSGSTGTNILKRRDLEDMIYSAILSNKGDQSSMVMWSSQIVYKTMAKWFDDKVQYISPAMFSVFGTNDTNNKIEVPMYQSSIGWKFPMPAFNEGKVSNLNDKILLLDMSNIQLVRLAGFARVKNMPITLPHDDVKKAVLDSMGLNFLYTFSSGFISNIDKY